MHLCVQPRDQAVPLNLCIRARSDGLLVLSVTSCDSIFQPPAIDPSYTARFPSIHYDSLPVGRRECAVAPQTHTELYVATTAAIPLTSARPKMAKASSLLRLAMESTVLHTDDGLPVSSV